MFEVREDEPAYAFLRRLEGPTVNQYGRPIELVPDGHALAGSSLNINNDPAAGTNPDRYKQHGFYFNADHCVACHACESACSEKNDLPPHLAFRSVGYVEGGAYPHYHRLNLSMACNHCDDPVCLKGCPTRAYTKFAEYGAVLQDPEICFGCGYCTWVCPYNAPQLDPVNGHVEKCNMCVDRLEAGLKPACVAACLAGALDFGVIETMPENRHQRRTVVPGFPDPGISRPNIRFQQTRSLPQEMVRTDGVSLRYVRAANGRDSYRTTVRDTDRVRGWNLKRLSSRENPLVLFTLATQAVVGAFLFLFLGPLLGLEVFAPTGHPYAYAALLFALLGLETAALGVSTAHLGKPHRFYRAFNNLRYSPVSREVAAIAVFYNLLALYAVLVAFPALFDVFPEGLIGVLTAASGWGAALAGPLALYFMHTIYRIPARPFWNHWQVLSSFYGAMLTLGSFVAGLAFAAVLFAEGKSLGPLMQWVAWPAAAGILLEGIGLYFHARSMHRAGEAAASHYEQRTTFGKAYWARNAGLAISVLAVAMLALAGADGAPGLALWAGVGALVVATAVVGRALFYVVVIPTSMPGGFFWRNRGFQEHARQNGLAHMPQAGVAPEGH